MPHPRLYPSSSHPLTCGGWRVPAAWLILWPWASPLLSKLQFPHLRLRPDDNCPRTAEPWADVKTPRLSTNRCSGCAGFPFQCEPGAVPASRVPP